MKIFTASVIKEWDRYTISNEPVSSIDLMERAALACVQWLMKEQLCTDPINIFCAKGNNGGDGLAIARILHLHGCQVSVFILESELKGSDDFEINFSRLQRLLKINFLSTFEDFPVLKTNEVVIDALFGTGLNKPIEGIAAALIYVINDSDNKVISIDLPSGLYADRTSIGNPIISATNTLTFQTSKLSLLLAENSDFTGTVHVLDIGLDQNFYTQTNASFEFIESGLIKQIYKPRPDFAHKGDFGFGCIIAGSYGMMGAAVLATRACLTIGAGKVVSVVPKKGYAVMQVSAPEAMTITSGTKYIKELPALEKYSAIGIGPGIGIREAHRKLLHTLFTNYGKPIVLDADALTVLSSNQKLIELIPQDSILTPHPAEFDRLFGKCENDFERIEKARQKAKELNIYIVLKGHHTFIATPGEMGYFNSTGNPGMATGGSGDVLTGIIAGLLAQQYSSLEACLLGVYLHGLAGDIAARETSQETLLASDIIKYLDQGFRQLH